ncbi:MAG TPA: protein phosphatase 2C domain-containing protein [Stellaceae bacterium]|nr:protein phosphatase 2C domain-containing protein [Stellaceae bacterium]
MEETSNPTAVERATEPPKRWRSAAITHVGKVRKLNEDAFFAAPLIGLWAVADGVGGADAGDRASGLIVEALGGVSEPTTASGFLSEVRNRLNAVNDALRREATARNCDAIASTVVALLLFGGYFACVWAGDSRLYCLRDGNLRQISRDHSEVQELVDQGVLDPADARSYRRANVITRAVGADESLVLDVVHDRVEKDDVFLLCSDGLTKTLEDAEIADILKLPVASSVEELVRIALERGAPDNVTVIAVQIVDPADGHG